MIRKHDSIRLCEELCRFRIRHIAIDERDPITIPALVNEVCRYSPALPGLANDGEPVVDDLIPWQRSEGANEIFQSFIWPNQAKKQKITA